MKYLSEKEAEELLKKFDFKVVMGKHCKKKSQIKDAISKIGFPIVMKVSGKKIVHKNKIGGVIKNINTYSHALQAFSDLKKIKGSDGAIIQRQLEFSKEYLIGVKKTPDFGHVVLFGSGGTKVEEKKDISFRVCPVSKEDVLSMIKEVEIGKRMKKEDTEALIKTIENICKFVSEKKNLSELDINPLIIENGCATVLDARMLFE